MEKLRRTPKKKPELSASDDSNRAKVRSKRNQDKKAESSGDELFYEKEISSISKNRKEKDEAKNHTPKKNKIRPEHEERFDVVNLISSSDDDIFSSKNRKKDEAVAITNDAFESLLSGDNKDKSKGSDSTGKKKPERSPKKQVAANTEYRAGSSSSEEDGTYLTKDKDKKKVSGTKEKESKQSPSKKTKLSADSSASHYLSDEEDSSPAKNPNTKNTATQSSKADESPLKDHKDKKVSDEKRKESKQSPSKKSKSHASHSSSDEEDLSSTKTRISTKTRNAKRKATQSSEESDTDVAKDRSKKEKGLKKRKAVGSPSKSKTDKVVKRISEKQQNTYDALSDQELSDVISVIAKESGYEKVFETLDEETAQDKRNTLETNQPSSSTDKESEFQPRNDRSSKSISKENDSIFSKNDKIETPMSDSGVKKARRGRPSKLLSQSNSSSDKALSSDGKNTPSKGEKNRVEKHSSSDLGMKTSENTPSKGEKNGREKQKASDSGVKKPGRGRPRKSESPAAPEQNAKLSSNSSCESSPSKKNGDEEELEEDESRRQSTKKTVIESVKEITSNPQVNLTGSAESPVYAVKSKPFPKKSKSSETQSKSEKADKQGKTRKSSRVADNAKAGTTSDKNGPSNNSKDSDGATNTAETDEKRKPIYTSSDYSSDSEDTAPPKAALNAKGKKEKVKREFSCHKCNAKFSWTKELFDHICEGKRDKGFACEHCDKIYKLRSTYVNHMIIHSRKKPYKCGLCGKKSASQSNHLYHMKQFHPERKPFLCEFFPCEKSYMTRREQTDHHKKHKRLICPYCDEEFAKNSTLLHHKYKDHEVFFS